MNAGVMYEKAKRPEDAADVYLDARREVRRQGAGARREGRVHRRRRSTRRSIYYDRAAKAYELVVDKFAQGRRRRADALYNAGLLRQALGQNDKAIAHYKEYAKQLRDAQGRARRRVQHRRRSTRTPARTARAYQAFADYARTYASTGKRVDRGAHARRPRRRSGSASTSARRTSSTTAAGAVQARERRRTKADGKTWAAEARYYEGELIFREYEKVTLDVKPSAARRRRSSKKTQAARRGREGLPLGRRLSGPQVGDRGAVPRRPDLRRVRRGARATRRKAAGRPHARAGPGVPGRAQRVRSSRSRTRPSRLFTDRLQEGDPDAGLRRVHREDPRGARPARRATSSRPSTRRAARSASAIARRTPSWSTEVAR